MSQNVSAVGIKCDQSGHFLVLQFENGDRQTFTMSEKCHNDLSALFAKGGKQP